MKTFGTIGMTLGIALVILGIYNLAIKQFYGAIPLIIGCSLILLAVFPNRISILIFGHACIIIGCFLTTWGIYLLPYSEPTITNIFSRPLFWGIFSIMGGICANYHGFCRCIKK